MAEACGLPNTSGKYKGRKLGISIFFFLVLQVVKALLIQCVVSAEDVNATKFLNITKLF